jgi:hypothetical protein
MPSQNINKIWLVSNTVYEKVYFHLSPVIKFCYSAFSLMRAMKQFSAKHISPSGSIITDKLMSLAVLQLQACAKIPRLCEFAHMITLQNFVRMKDGHKMSLNCVNLT